MDAIFRVENNEVMVSPYAAGPWNPGLQHGGAPSSLAVWAAEQVPTLTPMRIARLTIDLLRPVPIASMRVRSDIVREGKKIQLLSIHLESSGVEVARASILKVRRADSSFSEIAAADQLELPTHDQGRERNPLGRARTGFASGATILAVKGEFGQKGPAAVWFRFDRPFIEGQPSSPAMRSVATADFTNGVSSALDFEKWTFINADLNVSLSRDPIGEWILLDAETWLGPDGGGIAFARLADHQGYFGRVTQNLVIERR